jgi:hypothetical protein
MPGLSNALVLPTRNAPDDPTARAVAQLNAILADGQITAVAVIHGTSPSAATAFDVGKSRVEGVPERFLVWMPDASLAAAWQQGQPQLHALFAPTPGRLMTFIGRRSLTVVRRHGHHAACNPMAVDEAFNEAGLA